METLIQYSDDSVSDRDNCRPAIQITRRRQLQLQKKKQEHRRSLKRVLRRVTRIGNIRRVNFNNTKYGKGLDDFLTRAMKNPKPEDNILTQTGVSMKTKIKDGDVYYYSTSITMYSDSGAIGSDNRYTA